MASIAVSLPTIAATGLYSVTLPNRHNVVFDLWSALVFALVVVYLPAGGMMIGHMVAQRAREFKS